MTKQPLKRRMMHPARTDARYRRMRALGVGRYRSLLAIPLLLAAIVVVAWIKLPPLETARYRPIRYELNNPLMGWAMPAQTDPSSALIPHTLVHATLSWRDFEPREGEYDFAGFEENCHMKAWRERGMRMILRFVMDVPGDVAHRDIPDWLYEKMGDSPPGAYQTPSGQGFSPDYADFTLMAAHKKAIAALGERYDSDPFVAFVEMGSIGHNGEWWVDVDAGVPGLPLLLQVRDYFADYSAAFEHTSMLAVGPYQSARLLQLGLFNPFLGDMDRTWDWLDMVNYGGYEPQMGTELRGMGEYYHTAPSGAQFSRRVAAEGLIVQSPERLIEQLRESHTTYISGAPIVGATDELAGNMRIIHEAMGYRLWIRSAQWQSGAYCGESVPISLDIRNSGVAPMSQSWPVRLVLLDEEGRVVAGKLTRIDTRKLMPGESRTNESIDVPIDLPAGEYRLGIAIVDPASGEPAVEWAMVTEREGLISILGRMSIVLR